ncbi:polyketide cyclase dehydrase domain-containing [Cryptosporidium sp. chipmunk genotype I]|uniref:polyketide cyclase dehydrase domain-containing n=1 Tax=Cryptosporidium sp. chipmunk genotype I TaxID=1280935 RepID=UPI00351A02C7|nr:polyketide cyclase dehydrase domain-containing [Cryptosporidium sp. chipmunk genotype I]
MRAQKLNPNFLNRSKFSRGVAYLCERLVPYSMPELYCTVIDVAKYKKIFPWVSESEITRIRGIVYNGDAFLSRQKIEFGILGEYLYSIVEGKKPNSIIAYWPPKRILNASITIEKFSTPVKSHITSWNFIGNYKDGFTKVSCKLDFEFETVLFDKIAQYYIKDMTETAINLLIDCIRKRESSIA